MTVMPCRCSVYDMPTTTVPDPTQLALRAMSTHGLLRAAYSLTHQMHTSTASHADLRAQRALIDAEVLRRTGEA